MTVVVQFEILMYLNHQKKNLPQRRWWGKGVEVLSDSLSLRLSLRHQHLCGKLFFSSLHLKLNHYRNLVEIDFLKDSISLDGQNNFSASSNTYLKNAVRFAIFFASLELPYFRYPRLIICDNMEDKGMEQVRTQHFQKVITELSESYDVEHQIIFTTSMINPDLNNSYRCVGEEYSDSNKSLRF